MTHNYVGVNAALDQHYVMITIGQNSKPNMHPYWAIDGSIYEKLRDEVVLGVIKMKNGVIDSIEHAPTENQYSRYIPPDKLNKQQKVWRYLECYKFEDLIASSTLYLSRLDQFIDNLEGISPDSCKQAIWEDNRLSNEQKVANLELYKERMAHNRKSGFVCCWHINDMINRDMWDDYGKESNESIAIETSVTRLHEATADNILPIIFEKIRYYKDPFYNQETHWFPALFKHNDFEHEREYRCGVFITGTGSNKAVRIKVDLSKLITRIHINPKATKAYIDKIKNLLSRNGLNIPILVSEC